MIKYPDKKHLVGAKTYISSQFQIVVPHSRKVMGTGAWHLVMSLPQLSRAPSLEIVLHLLGLGLPPSANNQDSVPTGLADLL